MQERIAIVGAGRLGRSLLATFRSSVVALFTRRPSVVRSKTPDTIVVTDDVQELVATNCTICWLAVPDDVVPQMVERLSSLDLDWGERLVVHSSGAGSVRLLDPAREEGALTAVLHPNKVLDGSPIPPGTTWGVTADAVAYQRSEDLLAESSARLVRIEDEDRPLYHLAATLSANYTRTLLATAVQFYERAGIPTSRAIDLSSDLADDAISAARDAGGLENLTGPVARGDIETIRIHLQAAQKAVPDSIPTLVSLIETTCRLLDTEESRQVAEFLGKSDWAAH